MGLFTVVVLAAIAAGVFAFTASNTISAQKVGSGSAAASGYTITNIVYTFNDTNLANVDAVEFDLSASADDVRVQVADTNADGTGTPSGTLYPCALTGTVSAGGGTITATSTHPVCDLGAVPNATITLLTVAATELTP
jgi:hypothetical protein